MGSKGQNQTAGRGTEEPMYKQLWQAADKLRKNIDAAEYKHVVLGLVFLRYISDAFEKLHAELEEEGDNRAEDMDEYIAQGVFFVPEKARWSFIVSSARKPDIGRIVDDAMNYIEKENSELKGVLPKVYARQNLDPSSLGGLIDLIGNIDLGKARAQSADVMGHVFEYFLGEFAMAEGKKGGQFHTPSSIVKLLVEMIEPYRGRVYDPCCGSGGMFVMSEKLIREHQGRVDDISIFGQESNQTTYRLARMNLAIRGIDGSQVKWNSEGSFLRNEHPDLKADFVLANPPFNDSDWSGNQLRDDARWRYGVPPVGNANFAWVQHFVYHLSPEGIAGFVLSKGSLTSKSSNEDVIRRNLVDAGLVKCIVNLPPKLFLNTQIPACLWFLSRKGHGDGAECGRENEILFMDATDLGHMVNRRTREFFDEDIAKVADTYHSWREECLFREPEQGSRDSSQDGYRDIPGFCASVSVEKVRDLDYVLSPSRYVGTAEEEDDFDFAERFGELKAEFETQLEEEAELNRRIAENLKSIDISRSLSKQPAGGIRKMKTNYEKLKKSIDLLTKQYEAFLRADERELDEMLREALDNSVMFCFTTCHEMLWKHMKKFLEEEVGVYDVPSSPHKVFLIAHETAFIDEEMLERLMKYKGLRNSVSHDYSETKSGEVLEIIGDFSRDISEIYEAMTEQK